MDPGAVPGVSTISLPGWRYGDETGSTRMVKIYFLPGIVPPSSG
ncbi:hypothetical protein SACS_0529 [Parasaccharibacter apium]|uniref:Uncharacterized protein n=1 Tax=Parasaccharibacter apium TaxID=1510841 RepID=A0A7U7G508_9PROT|nr:hypothetical protein SACS_0529 [Parasaccharibacter apium]